MGEHFTVRLDERLQEVVLGRRELHDLPGDRDQPAIQIYLQLPYPEAFSNPISPKTPQQHPQPGMEFSDAERLREIIIRPRLEGGDFLGLLVSG